MCKSVNEHYMTQVTSQKLSLARAASADLEQYSHCDKSVNDHMIKFHQLCLPEMLLLYLTMQLITMTISYWS